MTDEVRTEALKILEALIARAAEIDYPVEAVLESAIASSLDPDALSFADCLPSSTRTNL